MSLRSTVLLSVLALSSRVDAQCGPPLTQELLPPDPQTSTRFGVSVAVSGDTIAVGNDYADYLVGGAGYRGAVYVWRRNGAGYSFEAKLPGFPPPHTQLGLAVDIDGDVLIASQFGSSYPLESARVYRRTGGVWNYEAQLQPADPLTTNGIAVRSLAVDGDWAAVGHRNALGANGWPSGFTGAVYLYEHSGGVWTQRAKVVPADALNGDSTGWSVTMDGGVLAFSSRAALLGNYAPAGRVHVYRIVGGAPVVEATLTASVPGQLGNDFGHALSTDGVHLAVSDPNDNAVGSSTGCVYVYGHSAGAWVELAVVRPSLPIASRFGAEVKLQGDDLYVSSASGAKGVWHFRRMPSGEWAELGISGVPSMHGWWVDSFDADGGQLAVGSRDVYSSSGALYAFDAASSPAVCTYCTALTTSSGCVPAIGWSGATSLSSGAFALHANSLQPNKSGLFFYGAHGANQWFQGGTLCVTPPLARTPLIQSRGAAACSGSSSLDFSAWIAGGFDPRLVAGTRWAAQYWSRDPQASYATNLTDTLVFTLLP